MGGAEAAQVGGHRMNMGGGGAKTAWMGSGGGSQNAQLVGRPQSQWGETGGEELDPNPGGGGPQRGGIGPKIDPKTNGKTPKGRNWTQIPGGDPKREELDPKWTPKPMGKPKNGEFRPKIDPKANRETPRSEELDPKLTPKPNGKTLKGRNWTQSPGGDPKRGGTGPKIDPKTNGKTQKWRI